MLGETPDRLLGGIDVLTDASTVLLLGADSIEVLQAAASLCVGRSACYAAVYLRAAGALPLAIAASDPRYVQVLSGLTIEEVAQAAVRVCGVAQTRLEPMLEGGRSIGTLALVFDAPGALEDVSRTLAQAVSTIACAALVRAKSDAAQQRIVDRLQRALLPTQLPTVDTIAFDAAYRPATKESDVGGDWYDAFDLGGGRIGISVGDVSGHGLDAAVVMGEARRAIRMAAPAAQSPSALLNYANTVLPLGEGVLMATAIAGFYDVGARTFQYACAGHPPPIMIAGGRTHILPGGGLPLGLPQEIASVDWTVTLPPGASLYFYTDGLLEYDRDIIAGERRLVEAIAQTAAANPEHPASALQAAIFDGIDNTDDAATLVLQTRGILPHRIALTYSSLPMFAAVARNVVRELLAERELDEDAISAILYAVGEGVANAIEHGSGDDADTFGIDLALADDRLEVVIGNAGHWKTFVPGIERGRGMSIMQALAAEVRVDASQDSTSVHLTFALPPPSVSERHSA